MIDPVALVNDPKATIADDGKSFIELMLVNIFKHGELTQAPSLAMATLFDQKDEKVFLIYAGCEGEYVTFLNENEEGMTLLFQTAHKVLTEIFGESTHNIQGVSEGGHVTVLPVANSNTKH